MTVRGRIECRISPGATATTDFFVTFHNFLLSLPGVTRIACNFGATGTGIDYRDAPTTIGTNAFAVFRFGSAITPFFVLVQCVNTTSTVASFAAPGLPGAVSINPGTSTATFGVTIAVAQRLDGLSPWGGGIANVGADAKSSPVWTAGASALNVWPRANAAGGTFATNREGMMLLVTSGMGATEEFNDIFTYGGRVHFLGDEENLMILFDRQVDGSFSFFYFGRYVPRPGITIQTPYVCLSSTQAANDPPVKNMNWGTLAQTTSNTFVSTGDGGVSNPIVANGVKLVYTDYPSNIFSQNISPNRAGSTLGRFDLAPVYVAINEAPFRGLLGTINFFRLSYNMPPMYLSPDRRLAAFGNGLVPSGKLVVPWDGVTAPGAGNSRQGISFTY